MFIETETTPNPATLKFLPGEIVMPSGTREFTSPEAAAASPLAETLFTLGDVTGVLFGRDFIAVTIAPGAEWAPVKPQVLALLLDAGGDINAASDNGTTPLMMAASEGRIEAVALLLQRGADPGRTTDAGRTASAWARASGHARIAERIEAAEKKK